MSLPVLKAAEQAQRTGPVQRLVEDMTVREVIRHLGAAQLHSWSSVSFLRCLSASNHCLGIMLRGKVTLIKQQDPGIEHGSGQAESGVRKFG